MADSTIGISEPVSPNKLLDSESVVIGLNTVERERVQIAGDSATDIAPVTAADGLLVKVSNTVPVSGTVSVSEPVSVDDNGSSLTVDGSVTAIAQPGVDIGDVTVNNGAGVGAVNIQDGGNTITVDGAVTVSGTATVSATDLDIRDLAFATDKIDASGTVLGASANNIGDVDVLTVPAPLSTTGGGTEATALRVTVANDSTGVLSVDDNGGSLTVDGTVAVSSLPASTNTLEVVGDVAHDAAAAGNPMLVCGIAQDMDDTAPPNQVSAENDATRIATDRDGGIFVHPHGPRIWSYHENSSSALTDTSVHAAPAGGLSLYVTDIVVSTGAATAFNVFFEEGSTTVLGPWYLEAINGRGLAIHFGTPKKITAATALTVTTSAAIAHSIDVTGFTAVG